MLNIKQLIFGFSSLTLLAIALPLEANDTQSLYWSDGDSGRLNGVNFRLANIDAPETGGIGARGGAKCEAERILGFKIKENIVDYTKHKKVKFTDILYSDRYGRLVVHLSANGQDLGQYGLNQGYYKAWPFKQKKALFPKPLWCE